MDHFPRFRRKKDVAPPPTLITPNDIDAVRKTTPPPGDHHPAPQPAASMRASQKLSPFRVFQRSSGKRARDSPPASLPHSPATAPAFTPDSIAGRPVSPLSLKTEHLGGQYGDGGRPPKIPAFLELSPQDIMLKYQEITWLERSRWQQGAGSPSSDHRWSRPHGQHLRRLDRYANIQPWYNNRVKLQVPEGHLDYINASPITLMPSLHPTSDGRTAENRGPDRYIAMQGPKLSSLDHTWRMIVEQLESPGVIVMLTETHEGHMEKCYPYFPRTKDDPPLEINERDEFGDGFRATVRCEGLEETPAGDAIELRKLVIRIHPRTAKKARDVTPLPDNCQNNDAAVMSPFTEKQNSDLPPALAESEPRQAFDRTFDETSSPSSPQGPSSRNSLADGNEVEERVVWHFLYKKWPDFGVPALADLESFFTLMRLSREKNAGPHNPRIVHCSAGVGRSGTFIALEHLIRELDAGVLEHYDERLATATPSPASANPKFGGRDSLSGGEGNRGSRNASPATTTREEEGEDLIFSVVNQLREQRGSMVQAEIQYLFIYQVMRKLWQDKYGVDSEEEQGEPAAKRLEVDPFVE
ncbi:tyrosine-protein phosphatase 1 [Naviculisporaceae sp. PSN 640]